MPLPSPQVQTLPCLVLQCVSGLTSPGYYPSPLCRVIPPPLFSCCCSDGDKANTSVLQTPAPPLFSIPTSPKIAAPSETTLQMFQILLSMAREGTSDSLSSSPARYTNQGRDGLITAVYKLHKTRQRILEPYRKAKNALKQLQEDYLHSKQTNAVVRYSKLQASLREVIVLEKQYWKLLDVPAQDPGEENADYVARVVDLLEGTPAPAATGIGALLGAVARADSRLDGTLYDAIKSRKTEELQKEAEIVTIQMHRLLKKYLGLRKLVKVLHERYDATRNLPILPRYSLLKKMIKNALRAPEFAEICHEQVE